jgi:RimJ/RimL family protein N-acetyltransferase
MKYKILSKGEYIKNKLTVATIDNSKIQQIRIWRNQQIDILRQNKFITEEQQQLYFTTNVFPLLEENFPEQILFNCHYEGDFIGYGGIVHISYENKTGEISFLLDPLIQDKLFYEKIFITFLDLMSNVAFEELMLNKLFTETFSTRIEHVSILEKAGYVLEGIRRSHVILNNQIADIYLHGKFPDLLK